MLQETLSTQQTFVQEKYCEWLQANQEKAGWGGEGGHMHPTAHLCLRDTTPKHSGDPPWR